jgi:hypothetical protein
MSKLGEITLNGKQVSVFEKPHNEPDFPWIDVEELAKAYLPRAEARRIVSMTHKFGEGYRACATARNGDRIATIICHAMAQGLCAMIDFKKGFRDPEAAGPVHMEYSVALGHFVHDYSPMSLEEMVRAFHNPGGPFLKDFREADA